ncbi:MAG: DUF3467 domain-containing protein [bacterium]|nr:DUF3467 domain-containing protein [bacterium]
MSDSNQTSQQIQIKLSDEKLAGSYATHISVSHTQEEFILDFVNLLPNSPAGTFIQRIIVSPGHAKRLTAVLQDLLKKFDNKEFNASVPVSSTVDNKIGFDLAKE